MTENNNPMQINRAVNNLPLALPPSEPVAEEKPLDRVKEQTEKKRQRERER